MLRASIHHYVCKFAFAARTSRGPMTEKTSWFIRLWEDGKSEVYGLGECGPLPGLSKKHGVEFETVLINEVKEFESKMLSLPAGGDGIVKLRDFFFSHKISLEDSCISFWLEK